MQQILQNESEGAADRFQRWVAPLHLLAADDVNDITLNQEDTKEAEEEEEEEEDFFCFRF